MAICTEWSSIACTILFICYVMINQESHLCSGLIMTDFTKDFFKRVWYQDDTYNRVILYIGCSLGKIFWNFYTTHHQKIQMVHFHCIMNWKAVSVWNISLGWVRLACARLLEFASPAGPLTATAVTGGGANYAGRPADRKFVERTLT